MARKFRIVHENGPASWRLRLAISVAIVGAVAVLTVGGWWAYTTYQDGAARGQSDASTVQDGLAATTRDLARQLHAEQRHGKKLAEELAFLKRSEEIDGTACKMVKASLTNLQKENANLREQLAFYRGIVTPEQASNGLRVYDFKVSPHGSAGRGYDFELLLVQSEHHSRTVQGTAQVKLSGLQGVVPKDYSLTNLMRPNTAPLSFSFKYFQELSGQFALPAGFRPVRVHVTLTPAEGGQAEVTQVYSWTNVEQRSAEE
ncbi:MAG: hypothetical protein EPN72_08070 [Nevskiaceae bacterium]|nr:MAG: hypothetical protein EPN63_04540 [Nevskiaceae bacterium]TBR73109.1 MAG: hypothetical protein EPN72_08070 [Nevskiaceae bacterium]